MTNLFLSVVLPEKHSNIKTSILCDILKFIFSSNDIEIYKDNKVISKAFEEIDQILKEKYDEIIRSYWIS